MRMWQEQRRNCCSTNIPFSRTTIDFTLALTKRLAFTPSVPAIRNTNAVLWTVSVAKETKLVFLWLDVLTLFLDTFAGARFTITIRHTFLALWTVIKVAFPFVVVVLLGLDVFAG